MCLRFVLAVFLLQLLHSVSLAQEKFDINAMFVVVDRAVQESATAVKGDDPAARTKAKEVLEKAIPGYMTATLSMLPNLHTGPQRNQRLRLLEEIGESAIPGLESAIADATATHNDLLRRELWDGTEEDAMLSAASIYRASLALVRIQGQHKAAAKLGVAQDPWSKPDATTTEAKNLFTQRWEVEAGTSNLNVRLHFPVESGVLAISVVEPGLGYISEDGPSMGKVSIHYFWCRLDTVGDVTTLHCASIADVSRTFSLQFSSEDLRKSKQSTKVTLESEFSEFREFGHWVAGESKTLRSVP